MNYTLTKHALDVIQERGIKIEWLEKALLNPALIEPCDDDPELERRYAVIPENGNRVLRVVVNKVTLPETIVSVYFDRSKRGKL